MSQVIVEVALVDEPKERNPNVMDAERYRLLVRQISERGFLQPILVRSVGERYEVVDGSHRLQAARELGLSHVAAVIANLDAEAARMARVAMNRLRGEVDLGVVASTIAEFAAGGASIDDMTLFGFTHDEISDLLHAVSPEDPLDGAKPMPVLSEEDAISKAPKPFVLELKFATKDQLATAKRGLRKASGDAHDMAVGLLLLIDGAEPVKAKKRAKKLEE